MTMFTHSHRNQDSFVPPGSRTDLATGIGSHAAPGSAQPHYPPPNPAGMNPMSGAHPATNAHAAASANDPAVPVPSHQANTALHEPTTTMNPAVNPMMSSTNGDTHTGMPHSSQVKTSSGKNSSTQATIGKVEHAIGSILCSDTLKMKGAAKEQEAHAVQAQKAELLNAERLEANANLARDRANAHAAHGAMHGHAHHHVDQLGAPSTVQPTAARVGGNAYPQI